MNWEAFDKVVELNLSKPTFLASLVIVLILVKQVSWLGFGMLKVKDK